MFTKEEFLKIFSNIIKSSKSSLEYRSQKVCQIENTFEKVILKVKKTDEFLKVACRKCDTFVTYFQKLKDVLTKTITLGGLRSGLRELRDHFLQLD